MSDKRGLILSAEEYFARRVVLGVLVRKPVSPWLQLIPGKFIFDAYKRSRETRLFSQYFMAPRKIAMDAAQRMVEGEPRDVALTLSQERIRDWLIGKQLDYYSIRDRQIAVVGLLIDHYVKLLDANGASHSELVTDAYHDREGYEDYLNRLARLENELDDALIKQLGNTEEIRKDQLLEREVKGELRGKDVDRIF